MCKPPPNLPALTLLTRNKTVGPAYPAPHPITPTRYPTKLFTRLTPAILTPTQTSNAITTALSASSKAEKAKAVQSLRETAVADLPVVRKREKQVRAGFGFFEQAMVTNASVVLLTLGSTIAATVVLTKRLRR